MLCPTLESVSEHPVEDYGITSDTSVETCVGETKIFYEKIVLWSCDIVSRTGDG